MHTTELYNGNTNYRSTKKIIFMFLTTKGRYAVMALLDVLENGEKAPVKISSIAERQNIDNTYLEQIFSKLKAEGMVRAFRGPGGGYKIAMNASDIKIIDIMKAAEEKLKITRCGLEGKYGCMSDNSRCATHYLWEGLENCIADFLESVTLEDVYLKKLGRAKCVDASFSKVSGI